MRRFRLCSGATVVIAVLLSILSVPAHADSYQILRLSNDANVFIDGIYASGAVVLSTSSYSFGECTPVPHATGPCYITYVNGLAFSGSDTPSPVSYGGGGSSGTECPAIPSEIPTYAVSFSFCNHGDVIYGVDHPYWNPDGSSGRVGIFSSSGWASEYIGGHYPSSFHLSINSYGDIVWDDFGFEEIMEAYNVTAHLGEVPEPGSWTLIAIGMLAATLVIPKHRFC